MQTARHTPSIRRAAGPRARGGFTLVEMLVAVGLVMLMMLLFTEVFQIATGSLRRQRGLAENDQKSRMLSILVKGDLDKRTFRLVLPFAPGEDPDTSPFPFTERRGYLYISENNPFSDADDVLQFTADVNVTRRSHDMSPFFGRATVLPIGTDDPDGITNNPNQPEFDDGVPVWNDSGRSQLAEISYFVRDRRLHRRVQLIRQPLREYEVQPQSGPDGVGENFFDQSFDPPEPDRYHGSFWRDFDYSAFFDENGPHFHGAPSLGNRGLGLEETQFPLAHPYFRFGHDHVNGQPIEFVTNGFIGRFTQEETSHADFVYPSQVDDNGMRRFLDGRTPMVRATDELVLNEQGVVSAYYDETNLRVRIGEDVLLSNVFGFDVKVWDDIVGEFVDIGHNRVGPDGTPGVYHQSRNLHHQNGIEYGPQGSNSHVYDTWHREINFADPEAGGPPYDPPPFGWIEDDPYPLRAIQITITYIDESSEQMRNMTLVHSFVD